MGFIGTVVALLGLVDLFDSKRSLPWWGDVIAIGMGALLLFVNRLMPDDEEDD